MKTGLSMYTLMVLVPKMVKLELKQVMEFGGPKVIKSEINVFSLRKPTIF